MIKKKDTEENPSKTQKTLRPYPRATLEDALKVPQALKQKNGGNPWPPSEVATAIGSTPKSTTFFYQTSASQAFGLTKGTRDAAKIELDSLGRAVVYAPSASEELEKKREAFFKVDIFKKVFDHYKGSNLPETKYLSNTLENEFNLHVTLHEEFISLFKENCKYLQLESSADLSKKQNAEIESRQNSGEGDSQTIVLSESSKDNAKQAFVIMPFSERSPDHPKGFFQEVLNSLVTPAASEAGFTVRTAMQTGSDIIQATIINALIDADLVIADLTEHNPNVLFELGIRMALNKPVLLIRARGTDNIFDVDTMLRVFDYNATLWTSVLKGDVIELTKHIKGSWEQRQGKTYMQILTKKG